MKCESWAHLDIAGVMECHGEVPFLDKGMSGMFFYIYDVIVIVMLYICLSMMSL